MKLNLYYNAGRILFSLGLLCIGINHLIFGVFPAGLEPVAVAINGVKGLAYTTGVLIIAGAVLILFTAGQERLAGVWLLFIVFLLILLLMQLPKALQDSSNAGIWTGFFEVLAVISGLFFIAAKALPGKPALLPVGRFLLIVAMLVFGALHIMYARYIVTLIPPWLPLRSVLNAVVIAGFFGAALSLLLKRWVSQVTVLLAGMFFIWFIVLHLPRSIAARNLEAEWTSAFLALSMSGVALLAGANAKPGKSLS
ncbi:MAG: hypothetical protein ABIU63_03585 [Chitinophagaceae bacterium]